MSLTIALLSKADLSVLLRCISELNLPLTVRLSSARLTIDCQTKDYQQIAEALLVVLIDLAALRAASITQTLPDSATVRPGLDLRSTTQPALCSRSALAAAEGWQTASDIALV